MSEADRPRVGISRCLLGDEVRYDGGHKPDPFLVSTLGTFVEWVRVCPEVEAGMGTPREPIQLVARADGVPSAGERVRLLGVRSRTDWTDRTQRLWRDRARGLAAMGLSGYVLKKDSPSCGLMRVRVHHEPGVTRTGRGLFAEALVQALPNLPIEEEGRLNDSRLRENFIERVLAYQRLRRVFAGRWTIAGLIRFHTVHKLQLLAHSRTSYDELGRLVAHAKGHGRRELSETYEGTFMRALARLATAGRHADVMMHVMGHLKAGLDPADRAELLELLADYRRDRVPLVAPMTLIRHHVRRLGVAYLQDQTYLRSFGSWGLAPS